MPSAVSEIFLDFVSLVYPRYCFACADGLVKGEDIICTKCIHDLPRTGYHLEKENPIYKRLFGRIPLHSAFAFLMFNKGGSVQKLMHEFKYNNHREIGYAIGRVYGEELAKSGFSDQFDVILPVPLHPEKHRRRGYNQSEEFAKGLEEKLSAPCKAELLQRPVKTDTQTKKTKLKRWENVKQVFTVQNPEDIQDRRILLVDDVITTGATIEACALALINSGCGQLSVCSMAYAAE